MLLIQKYRVATQHWWWARAGFARMWDSSRTVWSSMWFGMITGTDYPADGPVMDA